MIVPMKKVVILVQSKDSAEAIERLRTLGVVHVEHEQPPKGKDVSVVEQDLALGKWLFSLPSLTYFNRQFDESTIDLYGVASQLSTIEQWQEKVEN